MYASESEAWHWKMTDWNLWSRPLSVQTWGASSADGWSYYTWPFFWSHSLKEWCYTASDYGNAFVVNLGSGEWTIFGKTDKGVPSEEETAVVEETTVEVTTNADTTTEETEGFAPDYYPPGTVVEIYDTIDDESSIAFVSEDMIYTVYAENLYWVDIGVYTYEKISDNTAKVSTIYAGLDYGYNDPSAGSSESEWVYSSESSATRYGLDAAKTKKGTVSIQEPQDYAPTSLNGKLMLITEYGDNTSSISYNSNGTGVMEDDGVNTNFNYTYKKTGPREGTMEANITIEGIDLVSEFILQYMTTNEGYFLGVTKDGDTIVEYSFGKFSIE